MGGTFTPLVASVYGTLAHESELTMLTLSRRISERREMGWRGPSESCARIRIQVAIVKATSLCLRARSINNQSCATDNNEVGADGDAPETDAADQASDGLEDLAGEWADLMVDWGC
jgi:hypothetical protein